MNQIDVFGELLDLEPVACDVCGGHRHRLLSQRMRHDVNLPTMICEECGLCFTSPRPTKSANDRFYSKHYNRFHDQLDVVSVDDPYVKRSATLAEPRVELLERFLEPCGAPPPKTVFEIGAGAGQFQRAARRNTGWKVSGIEPGEKQQRLCADVQGLDVRHAFLQDLPEDEQTYDAVVSFHVLEHALSPVAFLTRARRLLKPAGVLYLEVPNLERPGGPLSDFLQLPHLFNFTALTLRNVLSRAGFAPRFWREKTGTLSVVASPAEPREVEAYDVDALVNRLKAHERMVMLSRVIPNVGPLRKVRSTLMSM